LRVLCLARRSRLSPSDLPICLHAIIVLALFLRPCEKCVYLGSYTKYSHSDLPHAFCNGCLRGPAMRFCHVNCNCLHTPPSIPWRLQLVNVTRASSGAFPTHFLSPRANLSFIKSRLFHSRSVNSQMGRYPRVAGNEGLVTDSS